jgi:hypothetical protein
MALFFIDTATGQVATQRQLLEAGIAPESGVPPRPWLRVQGTGDASTMWYAVLRKRERGVYIGTLVLRHQDHHASLLARGWEEVAVEEIAAFPGSGSGPDRQAM